MSYNISPSHTYFIQYGNLISILLAANGTISFFLMAEYYSIMGFLDGSVVKNLPANEEAWV